MQRTCSHCERVGHEIENCRIFLAKPLKKRKEFVLYKESCFGCLGTGHMSRRCKRRKHCKFCDKMHPSSMHCDVQKPKPKRSEETVQKVIVSSAEQTSSGTTFEPVHGIPNNVVCVTSKASDQPAPTACT